MTTPCFAGEPRLDADAVYTQFEKHAQWWWLGEEHNKPPAETFGTCTVHDGAIRDADGSLVAEITCGLVIKVRGIQRSSRSATAPGAIDSAAGR